MDPKVLFDVIQKRHNIFPRLQFSLTVNTRQECHTACHTSSPPLEISGWTRIIPSLRKDEKLSHLPLIQAGDNLGGSNRPLCDPFMWIQWPQLGHLLLDLRVVDMVGNQSGSPLLTGRNRGGAIIQGGSSVIGVVVDNFLSGFISGEWQWNTDR